MYFVKEYLILSLVGLSLASFVRPNYQQAQSYFPAETYGYQNQNYQAQYYGQGGQGYNGYGYNQYQTPSYGYDQYQYQSPVYGYNQNQYHNPSYGYYNAHQLPSSSYGYNQFQYQSPPYRYDQYSSGPSYGIGSYKQYPGSSYKDPAYSVSQYQSPPSYGPINTYTQQYPQQQQYVNSPPSQYSPSSNQLPVTPPPQPPVTPPVSPPNTCDDTFEGGCYHLSWRHGVSSLTWNAAKSYCEGRGMRMISLDVPAKSTYFLNRLRLDKAPYFWAGAFVKGKSLIWENGVIQAPIVPGSGDWSRTRSSQTGRFQPEQTNECLAVLNNFYPNDGVKWHDVACFHKKPTICEQIS